jgi:predicted nucleic acid-binding protein
MHERAKVVVTNTTPLIALTAALGSLEVLQFLYVRVVVPFEVAQEVRAGGAFSTGVDVFESAKWLDVQTQAVVLSPFLKNSLDAGEASVIQTAINFSVPLACIDEEAGRRIARLNGLTLTGTLGVLIKAKQLGFPVDMKLAIANMRQHGIWLSQSLIDFALSH